MIVILSLVVVIQSVFCMRLLQSLEQETRSNQYWEEYRFKITRVLSEIQMNLLGATLSPCTVHVGESLRNNTYQMNLLSQEKFITSTMKLASRLKIMSLAAQSFNGLSEHNIELHEQQNIPDVWPTIGTISSMFGLRHHPIHKTTRMHRGVDIANLKNTEITATANGKVQFSGRLKGYGNAVILDHGNGFETLYGHAEDILVNTGDTVGKGDLIASMGSTGLATGDHLHYEIRFAGEALDPVVFVK